MPDGDSVPLFLLSRCPLRRRMSAEADGVKRFCSFFAKKEPKKFQTKISRGDLPLGIFLFRVLLVLFLQEKNRNPYARLYRIGSS